MTKFRLRIVPNSVNSAPSLEARSFVVVSRYPGDGKAQQFDGAVLEYMDESTHTPWTPMRIEVDSGQ